ncbi:NUDIX hydrolase [Capnocytophaga sp. ARDL2]|uniref:NUDIX hydrolase n=1 Tax=Capnocytophaga sp. ARDL2 TaxID=3238809 RepID=UPI00355639A3
MYKIFIKDKLLVLTNQLEQETDCQVYLLETVNLKQLFTKYFDETIDKAILYHPNKKILLEKFLKKVDVERAGGGRVYNDKGEILFIFRNGRWDLPKGGVEKNEKIEQTAMREVEEETGCKKLTIKDKIAVTYHVFKRNGRFKLKETHWFNMKSTYTGKLAAQLEENIEKVEWIQPNEVTEKLKNSFDNIRLLFEK